MHGGTGQYPAWLADVAQAGFESLETFSYDVWQEYSHVAWRGRIRASLQSSKVTCALLHVVWTALGECGGKPAPGAGRGV